MSPLAAACARFREFADALALGEVDGPLRHELLEHSSRCAACQAHLSQLTVVTDRLLLMAPSTEPPPGFEGRVLERLANARGDGPAAEAERRRRTRLRGLLAAAVLLTVAVVGATAGRLSAEHTPELRAISQGRIIRADGSVAGMVRVVDRPRPMVLITIDAPRKSDIRVTCSLVKLDWTSVPIGSWVYGDIEHGAWAAGIDASLLGAIRMNVLDPNGGILATAELTTV
jgi:hypothetical protein